MATMYLSIKMFTCPKEQISFIPFCASTIYSFENSIKSDINSCKQYGSDQLASLVNSVDPNQLASLVNSVNPDQLAPEEAS